MVDAFAAAKALENFRLLMLQFRRDQDSDRATNDLIGPIAEEPFGAFVPTGDDAFETFADDGIIRGLDDCAQPLACLGSALGCLQYRLLAGNLIALLPGRTLSLELLNHYSPIEISGLRRDSSFPRQIFSAAYNTAERRVGLWGENLPNCASISFSLASSSRMTKNEDVLRRAD